MIKTETQAPEQTLSLDDILDNPKKFGIPTFEDFAKSPEKYRTSLEHLFESVDRGSSALNRLIIKHEYLILGHRADSLEQVQRIMTEEGYTLDQLTIQPELHKETAGKLKVVVSFIPKERGAQIENSPN